MRVLHALLIEKAATRWAQKLDSWMHFHRFEVRRVCDVHDWLHGVPMKSARQRPAHQLLRSYRNHPSSQEAVSSAR